MKSVPLVSVLALLMLCQASVSAYEQPAVQKLQAKDHIVIFGDSTTAGGLGPAGYVQLLIQALNEQAPGVKVSAICKNSRSTDSLLGPQGWILGRFVELTKAEPPPTVALIVLGLNDSKAGPNGVEPYAKRLREAVGLLRERKQTVILTTPATWGGLTQTKPYAEAARSLATELKCPLIDLYAVQSELITNHTKDGKLDPVFKPTSDGVHLSAVGDTLWAGTMLKAFGLKSAWQKYQLRTVVSGPGEIVVEPKQPNYEPGAKITLICKPKTGMVFVGWVHTSGEPIAGNSPTLTITMDRHMHIQAQVKGE